MKRRSKDLLRKDKQRIVEEIRKLDLEDADHNLREKDEEKLSWDENEGSEEKRKKLRTELEEIQRDLMDNELA